MERVILGVISQYCSISQSKIPIARLVYYIYMRDEWLLEIRLN